MARALVNVWLLKSSNRGLSRMKPSATATIATYRRVGASTNGVSGHGSIMIDGVKL